MLCMPARQACATGWLMDCGATPPSRFHGDVAAASLHWYDQSSGCWLSQHREHRGWAGWTATDAAPAALATLDCGERPWATDLDPSGAPFYRWFVGGLTNAGFSECDRHVLAGHGERAAFIVDPPALEAAPCRCTYRELLLESGLAASSIQALVSHTAAQQSSVERRECVRFYSCVIVGAG